ncbi:MAG: NAD-dependent epimerase/dehydratase family protein [Planctomycetota bacterium]
MALFLVTGGAGFIGSHLAAALAARGDRVRVLDDLSSGRLENLAPLAVGEIGSGAAVELLRGDVADPEAARRAARGVEGIFHTAAQVSVPASVEDPRRSYAVNVLGTLNVLEAAREEGVRRLVLSASSAAYGDAAELPTVETMAPRPCSPYASGKLAAEALFAVWGRLHGLRTVSLRYFNVYGPRQADDSPYSGVIALFARRLLAGLPVTIHGDGEQTRDFVFVADVVRANLAALAADLEPGEVLNVGTGEAISMNELFARLAELAGVTATPRHGPPRPGDVRYSRADVSRIRARLGWRPRVAMGDGLAVTLDWYRRRG